MFPPNVMSIVHPDCLGGVGPLSLITSTTFGGWDQYIPFRIKYPVVYTHAGILNGTVVSGNIDIGIYDSKGTRLGSTGSTAQAGISVLQRISLTSPVSLGAGLFYMAFASSDTVGTSFAYIISLPYPTLVGIRYKSSLTVPLAADASTWALNSGATSVFPAIALFTDGYF